MKIGIITYESLHCNFTNYGTVLQAWALNKAITKYCNDIVDEVVLVDYCAQTMADKDPLNPFEKMWDRDNSIRKEAALMLPAIRANFEKIYKFYHTKFNITSKEYHHDNIDECSVNEDIDGYIVGSDSIWDIDEFGVDDAFWANAPSMQKKSIAYAPSFQDSLVGFNEESWRNAKSMIRENFRAVSLRDKYAVDVLKEQTHIEYPLVLDPTLLLETGDYLEVEEQHIVQEEPYLLFYSRRFNQEMDNTVRKIAKERNLKVVEISIRASNATKSTMRYDAGVEEFLSLVKNAEVVVTNSFHCMIFAIQYQRDFYVFSRQHCYNKIAELLDQLGLLNRFISSENAYSKQVDINYNLVKEIIDDRRESSLNYLRYALTLIK